jgi:hypothetical protein
MTKYPEHDHIAESVQHPPGAGGAGIEHCSCGARRLTYMTTYPSGEIMQEAGPWYGGRSSKGAPR